MRPDKERVVRRPARKLTGIQVGARSALFALATIAYEPAHADSWRCGTRLVTPGELALQVRAKCGDPVSEELIGYTLRPTHRDSDGREREYKIEQWVYGPEQGYYHVLIFEAGRLHDIDNIRE